MESHQNQFFCDICELYLNSRKQLDCHMSGKVHLRAIKNNDLQFDQDITIISKNEYRCNVCEVSLNGIFPVDDHLKGVIHLKKKEHQKNKIIFDVDDNIKIISTNKYFCELCKISCSSDITMTSHIKGSSHIRKKHI